MSKYHITKSGKTARCRAVIRSCPLQHYETKQEADDAIQSQMSDEYGMLSVVPDDSGIDKDDLENKYNNQHKLVKAGKFKSREDEELERTQLAKLSRRMRGNDSEVTNLRYLLKDLKKPDAGVTMSISTKNNQKAIVATAGFCASPYPEYSKVFNNAKEINHSSILEFMDNIERENEGIFSQEDLYIGLWNEPGSGKIYLDLSKRYNSAKDARIACEKNDQIAYYDLQMSESVIVDSKATSGQAL